MASLRHGKTRMIVLAKRLLALALLTVPVALAPAPAFASDDWQVIKVVGHDYLSVDNIAKFYSFPAGVPFGSTKIGLADANRSLELTPASREMMINGAPNWLCVPVIEHDGKFLASRID